MGKVSKVGRKKYLNMVKILICGIIVGVLFRVLKLPIPAPEQIEGIFGIFGIFIGYNLWKLL